MNPKLSAAMLTFVLCVGVTSVATTQKVPQLPRLSAPVVYKDSMLVVVTKDGAAAVVFTEVYEEEFSDTENRFCVNYDYRYESMDGKTKKSGSSKVYERYTKGKYDKGVLNVIAGPIKFEWSKGGEKRGWIYYQPEQMRVHIAHAQAFKDQKKPFGGMRKQLDLRRFMQK